MASPPTSDRRRRLRNFQDDQRRRQRLSPGAGHRPRSHAGRSALINDWSSQFRSPPAHPSSSSPLEPLLFRLKVLPQCRLWCYQTPKRPFLQHDVEVSPTSVRIHVEAEVPLQVLVPKHIRAQLGVMAALEDKSLRAVVLPPSGVSG